MAQIKVGAAELVRSDQFLGEEAFGCYFLARIQGGSVLTHLHFQWSGPLQPALLDWAGVECSLQM